MALKAGYKGFKKLLSPLKLFKSGELGIDSDVLNTELNTVFFPRSEQAVLGAVNLFNNIATTDTVGGIECTVNADKTVTASGTYSGGTYVQFTLGRVSVKAGQILKGCPSGGGTSTYQLILFNSAQTARLATDLGEGAVVSADDSNALLAIYFHASVTDKVFKPQICLSMDTPYAPFAMTNEQLTDAVQGITVKKFTSAELAISAGQFTAQELNIVNGDLIPLGVVGYTIGGSGNTDCTMWKCWMDLTSKKVLYGVKNNGAATQATVTVDIFVLYIGGASTVAANRSLPDATRESAPDAKEIIDEPVVEKTTTKRATKKSTKVEEE